MKNLVKILSLSIHLLSLVALWGILNISIEEWKTGEGCPKFADIPICYLITILVIILIFSHFATHRFKFWFFIIGAGIPWLIAVFGSYLQYSDIVQCPKSTSGIPMCYISLILFSAILSLFWLRRVLKTDKYNLQ